MSFFKRLSKLFSPTATPALVYHFSVQCKRCGEVIPGRIDLRNDVSPDYDDATRQTTYFCRKVLVGSQRCYQPIEVLLRFDANRKLIDRQISGGDFVDMGEEAGE